MPTQAAEKQRLDAVRRSGLVGTAPEPWFDMFTEAASQLLETPMAAITLLTQDRQWFKSACGIDTPSTARADAFCNHTIAAPDGRLVVRDARQDPRFRGNALVLGPPHAIAYAGVAVRAPDGHALGALCVIDRRPREFSPAALAQLDALAHGVEAVLARYQDGLYLDAATWQDIFPEAAALLRRP
jgi:GAF domain-containing protein